MGIARKLELQPTRVPWTCQSSRHSLDCALHMPETRHGVAHHGVSTPRTTPKKAWPAILQSKQCALSCSYSAVSASRGKAQKEPSCRHTHTHTYTHAQAQKVPPCCSR
eukprot:1157507-Pelagomonas_calceolata.AAC.1